MKCLRVALLLPLLVWAIPAVAQTAEERAAARGVATTHGNAIVTVMATLKARMSAGGQDKAMPDQAVQASATVLDATGLTVLAMSALDPGNIIGKTPQFAQGKMSMNTEVDGVRMRLPDGKEVPARVVLRDSDLDLLFVRPETAPETPMAAVGATSATLATLDGVVLVRRLGELTGWQIGAALGSVEAIVDKPRTFYMVAFATTSSRVGATVFDLKGGFAGVVTLRAAGEPQKNALTGLQGDALQTLGMITAVIPAADIREVAKQAK